MDRGDLGLGHSVPRLSLNFGILRVSAGSERRVLLIERGDKDNSFLRINIIYVTVVAQRLTVNVSIVGSILIRNNSPWQQHKDIRRVSPLKPQYH